MNGPRRAGVLVALLAGALASGCMRFSTEEFCGANPEICEPRITSVTPSHGPAQGGTTVEVNGTAFHPDTVVEVDGVAAETYVTSPTNLSFVTPPGVPGTKDLILRSRSSVVTVPAAFKYASPPRLTRVSPTRGSTGGGTPILVIGTDLGAGLEMKIGGKHARNLRGGRDEPGTPQAWLFESPPLEAGVYDVELFNQSTSMTLPGAFTYETPWTRVGTGLAGLEVPFVAGDPAGTVAFAAPPGGLFRSTNQGFSWTRVTSIPEAVRVWHVVVEPGTGVCHAGTSAGYFQSTDHGETWRALNAGFFWDELSDRNVYSVAVARDGTVYATTRYRAAKLRPGSIFWNTFTPTTNVDAVAAGTHDMYGTNASELGRYDATWTRWETLESQLRISALAVLPGAPDTLYLSGPNGLDRKAAGAPASAWTRLHPGPAQAVAVHPLSGHIVLVTPSAIRESADAGATWSTVEGIPAGVPVTTVGFSGADVLASTPMGVFVHSPGQPFELRIQGLPGRPDEVTVDPTNRSHLYAITPVGLFQSRDGAVSWVPVELGERASRVKVDPRVAGRAFAVTGSGLWRTTDAGVTWARVGPGRRIRELAVSRLEDGVLYITAEDGIWRSADAGETWTDFSAGFANAARVAGPILASPLTADTVYTVALDTSYVYGRTRDTHWAVLPNGSGTPVPWVSRSVSVDPGSGTLVTTGSEVTARTPSGDRRVVHTGGQTSLVAFAESGTGRMFMQTSKGPTRHELELVLSHSGWNFTPVSLANGLPPYPIHAFATDPVDDSIVYASTSIGLYKSTVGGL